MHTHTPEPIRGEATLIAMVLPGPAEEAQAPALSFMDVHQYLHRLGIRIPAIDYVDIDHFGVLLLEDLGDSTFEAACLSYDSDADRERMYLRAIDLLITTQRRFVDDDDRECICWHRQLDRGLLRRELEHYVAWAVDARYGRERLDPIRGHVASLFDRVVDELGELSEVATLRDYQSRNIMLKSANDWVIIDFQDAARGPFVYDLVGLLRDPWVELSADAVDRLLEYYTAARLPWCLDTDLVHRAFHLQTVQSKLKDAARFAYASRVAGSTDFTPQYERSMRYVQHALAHLPDIAADPSWGRGLLS